MCRNPRSPAGAAISGAYGTFRRGMLMGGGESLGVDLEIDNLILLCFLTAVAIWKLQVKLGAPVSPCLPYSDRLCPLEQQAKISHFSH